MVKKKRKRVSARRRVDEKRKGDTSSYLRLLEGIKSFEMDGKPRVVDILSWPVKQSNAYADKGDLYFEKTFWVHNSIGPNKDRVVCPAKTLGKRCPICDHKARLANDPESDADLIKSLNPKERQLFLINDLKSDDGGLQVWDVSYYLFGKNLEERLATADEDDDWMGYADPEEGLSLRIAFSEESFQGKVYYSTASIDFRSRKVQYTYEEAEANPSLDDLLVIQDYDTLKKLFLMEDDVDDDDDDDDDEAPKKKAAPKKKESVVDDDDDWEEEDDDDEEEEVKPTPKKKRAPKKKAEPEPEEDDDDGEDDEEEEVKPPPKKKSTPTKKAAPKKKEPVADDDDEWDDDWDSEDDEEEEEIPAPKKKAPAKKPAPKKKAAGDDDEWDDDWDD